MGVYLGSDAVDMQGGFVTGGASGAVLQSKTVSPSESAQTIKADYGYDGLSQVTVNAVSKTYVGSGVTKKSAATYTPGTSDQNIASGQYLNGTQTIKGDNNLTAGNIKSGVSIFGVSGTYTGSSSGGSGSVSLQSKTVSPSERTQQRQRALELEKRIKICDVQMERMRGILNQSEFDEELVHELIKKIYVGMDNSVEVEFKCSDPYQEVLAIMSEVQNE